MKKEFEIRSTPDAAWERHLPPMPPDTLINWRLSRSYDGLPRKLERPPSAVEIANIHWEDVEPSYPALWSPTGIAKLRTEGSRFSPIFPRASNPSRELKVIHERTTIDSDRDQVKKTLHWLQRRRERFS